MPTENWAYMGRRFSNKKLYHYWRDSQGMSLGYSKLSGMVGYIYEIEAIRDGDVTSVRGTPNWLHAKVEEAEIREWTVADYSAQMMYRDYRRNERLKKEPDALDEAMKPLLAYARTCRTKLERDFLTGTIIRRMTDIWY